LTGKTAVITGGSQGIGAGVAIRFAQAGANVIVVGRSSARLENVVSEARKVVKSTNQNIDFISADLSLVSDTQTAASKIEAKSNAKVDFLVQTQGGTPNGLYETTSEGIESHFATQVLSRFLLNYILASSGVLKEASVSVMAPGGTQTEFNLDDIELASSKDAGRYAQMAKHVSRDGVIADTYTKALQANFPQIKFFHVFPGLVQTNIMTNQNLPVPVKQLINYVVYPIASRTFGNTVESYADIPVFLAANKAAEELAEKEGYFLDNNNKKASLSPYALAKDNQEAVFNKLKGYLSR
jgi:NAD(P)-dependent dehydrogenase (short-subunit alcohol dehydrogenase family)